MSLGRAQRSVFLVALVLCLVLIDVRYSAVFFGVPADASLAHLHTGLLLALALLARDPMWLRVAVFGNFLGWQWKSWIESPNFENILVGTSAMLVTYGALRAVAFATRWPAAGEQPAFTGADITRALLFGSVVLPLVVGASWFLIAWMFLSDPMSTPAAMNSVVQTVLAKCFGVLILTLPLVVLVSDSRGADPRSADRKHLLWALPVIGAAAPMAAMELLGPSTYTNAALALFLDYRLIVAGILLLVAISTPLYASMTLLTAVQAVFAIGLAVQAGLGRDVADAVDLLRAAFELAVMQMLVMMTLVYNRERNRILARVAKANTALTQRNQELQQFVMAASHDLQEPLRKIIMFGDRVRSDVTASLSQSQRDHLDRMDRSARRMRALIEGLLDYSRVSTAPPVRQSVALNAIVSEVIEDLSSAIESSQAEIVVGPLPTIDADPVQMRQLLQNLIGNALRYRAPDRRPRITVDARAAESALGESVWELRVADNGIGFDSEQRERIFGLFQRLHGRDTYEGTGLGLSIVRRIAEQHRGTATAIGHPGEGAEFIITLPVR